MVPQTPNLPSISIGQEDSRSLNGRYVLVKVFSHRAKMYIVARGSNERQKDKKTKKWKNGRMEKWKNGKKAPGGKEWKNRKTTDYQDHRVGRVRHLKALYDPLSPSHHPFYAGPARINLSYQSQSDLHTSEYHLENARGPLVVSLLPNHHLIIVETLPSW